MSEAPKAENIRVICRVRPLNPSEVERGSTFAVELVSDKQISVPGAAKPYTFDHVISPQDTQRDVFEIVARPIISDVMNGFNGTIFAYGQTASGKTHSMEGDLDNPEEHGLIPNIVFEIFRFIETLDEHFVIQMEVSFVELYKEKFQDLLNPSSINLAVHEDANKVPYLKGVTKISVCSAEEIFEQLERGKGNCAVSSTDMNAQSSRSHRVFSIEISTTNTKENHEMKGKLFLVDLAGSEKVSKTGAMGNTLEEAKMINKSLSTLGNVINALVEGHSHIPYRDSKLTRILQESLGGNAKTTMLICVSPASYNAAETKSTLMFGMRAKSIKNTVAQQIQLSAEEWQRRYEMECAKNERLRTMVDSLVSELESWRAGETVNVDKCVSLDDIKQLTSAPKKPPLEGVKLLPVENGGASSATSSFAAPQAGGPTCVLERPSALDNEKMEELYNMLDMKDEEINTMALINDRLKKEMQEQSEMVAKFKSDNENMYAELTRLQGENEASKSEVKEVLQALEELAMSYDQKATELLEKHRDLETMQEQVQKQRAKENLKEGELQELKENLHSSKKKQAEMMNYLLKEITEVGDALLLTPPSYGGAEKLDEEFTVLRLHLKKMRSEATSLRNRCDQLEMERNEERERIRNLENEGGELKLKNKELASRVESCNEKVASHEAARSLLEAHIESLKTEITELRTKEDMMQQVMSERGLAAESADGLKIKMDNMLENILKTHSAHLNEELALVRKQLDEKSRSLEESRESLIHLTYQNQQLTEQRSRLQIELDNQVYKLEQVERQHEKREQAKQDLRGLEETVVKELQTLHSLRKLFVQDLQARIKKSSNAALNSAEINANGASGLLLDDDSEETGGFLAQRQKIQFLEKNLDSLTSVHKQLVRDNADLRTELPKLEKRLKATVERVKALESALKEAKEGAMRDRKRYQAEVDRIKEVVRQKQSQQCRVGGAKIQKKITGGGGGAALLQRPLNM